MRVVTLFFGCLLLDLGSNDLLFSHFRYYKSRFFANLAKPVPLVRDFQAFELVRSLPL